MELVTWGLAAGALLIWLGVGPLLAWRPPMVPLVSRGSIRRVLWVVLWGAAMAGSLLGPRLWTGTRLELSHRTDLASPGDQVTRTLRLPFLMQERDDRFDIRGEWMDARIRTRLHLPVGLLGFFGLLGWGWHKSRAAHGSGGERGGGSTTRGVARSRVTPLVLLILVGGMPAACGGDAHPEGPDRPTRTLTEVAWDTVFHLRVAPEDTLLYSASRVAAGEAGIWVADLIGHRIAHIDWSGELQWYAGGRGQGPGEFSNPRVVSADGLGGVWVVDHDNARITGFDATGALLAEISLRAVDAAAPNVVVSQGGDRFLGMIYGEGLVPLELDRNGQPRAGRILAIPGPEGAQGFALQGLIARESGGDRWVFASSFGDGIHRMDGTSRIDPPLHFPEEIPFPRLIEEVVVEGNMTSRTLSLSGFHPAADGVALAQGKIFVLFVGETEHRARILDIYDFETGAYEESVLVPRPGALAAWEDRIVLAYSEPTPGVLVIRRRE